MKKESTKKTMWIRDATLKQAKELADEKQISIAAIIEQAIQVLYSQDTVDENLLLGRMSSIERKIGWLNNKSETFFKLMYYIMPFIFACLPDLPKDSEQRKLVLDKGSSKMMSLVKTFRKNEKENDIAFMQAVYGDSQETLEENYTTSTERHS